MPMFKLSPQHTDDLVWENTQSKGRQTWTVRSKDIEQARLMVKRVDSLAVKRDQLAQGSPWDSDMFCEIKRIHSTSPEEDGPDEIIEPAHKEPERAQIYGR